MKAKTGSRKTASRGRAERVLTGPWDTGQCRYLLVRRFFGRLGMSSPLGFVMLNPSTADASEDDPTIRRCLGFAQRGFYGGVLVANLSPYRATHPRDLRLCTVAEMERNLDAWHELRSRCPVIVLAWGGGATRLRAQAAAARLFFGAAWCLGKTKTGEPRHPLFVHASQKLVPCHA